MSFGRILIAIDGSKPSFKAARVGFDLAATLAAQVATVYAAEPPVSCSDELGIRPEEFEGEAVHDDEAVLRALRKAVHVPPGAHHVVHVGHPAETILHAARSWAADLLVLGSHGRSGLRRVLIGSVAETVVRRAPCPVLIIPAAERRVA
jgi:nucleotide-binding universal stress UspA family protein